MHTVLPSARFDVAAFGELVSDPSRVTILLSLMDGLSRPVSELAQIAGVSASTASAHLARLEVGGLLRVEQRGRHRYFRLADEHVAEALELIALRTVRRERAALAPPLTPQRVALRRARTCYKHLAGELGVAWLSSLEADGLLAIREGALTLAPAGVARFEGLGLSLPTWPAGKSCLDWTERRNHLGGPLGVVLTEHLVSLKWLARREEKRALRVTTTGRAGLARFGIPASLLG